MKQYRDLTATQRDTLVAIAAVERDVDSPTESNVGGPRPAGPTPKRIHAFHEANFGPISRTRLSGVLGELVDSTLSVKKRSESDGRVWVYRLTDAGRRQLHQAMRERRRWLAPLDPVPERDEQTTLAEALEV